MFTVREIWRYPVKSMGGQRLEAARVGEHGISGDRSWGVRDEMTGTILTGRREPRLLMASARLEDGDPIITLDDGSEITTSGALSAWLDRPVELVPSSSTPATFEGVSDIETELEWKSWQGPIGSFHDSRSTVSMVSYRTLGDYDARRFRINLLLDGSQADDNDDQLVGSDVTIGSAGLHIRKPITRCVMITRAQPGLRADLGILKRVISERDNKLGIGATVHREGGIAVGDVVLPVRS